MIRPVSCLVLFAALLLVADGWCDEAAAPGNPDPEYLKALEDARKTVEEVKKQYEKMAKEAGVDEGPLGDALKDPFGAGEMEKRLEEMKEAARKVVVTDEDRAGLDLYCKGLFASATKAFEASREAKPGRPFPDYFLGCIAFQAGDYAKAVGWFDKVITTDKSVTSAHLFKRLSELCREKEKIDDLDLIEFFYQACNETEVKLNIEPPAFSFAEISMPALLSDPVIFKCQELLVHITRLRAVDVAKDYEAAKAPSDKLMLGLMLADEKAKDALVAKLAKRYPDDRDVQEFALLYKYFGPSGEKRRKESKTFAEELDKVRKMDPENGVLMLLAIPNLPPKVTEVNGRSVYNYTPLSEEEKALLHHAAQAGRFQTYVYFRWKDGQSELMKRFGGFLGWREASWPGPRLYSTLLEITRRTNYDIGQLLENGSVDEAVKLNDDLAAIWSSVVKEYDSILTRSLADDVRTGTHKKMLSHDTVTGQLRKKYWDEDQEALQRQMEVKPLMNHIMALVKSPIRRLAEVEQKLITSVEMRRAFHHRMTAGD